MSNKIRVAILDNHQGIIDGYLYRFGKDTQIEVVATISYGEELEQVLTDHTVDVLILDIQVSTASNNPQPFPIQFKIAELLNKYPELAILVISMYHQPSLIQDVMKAGASGYIFKDDRNSIQELCSIVHATVAGGIHFSQGAYQHIYRIIQQDSILTPRQLQAISMCASYPEANTAELARLLGVANSTFRNLLSGIYTRLGVKNRISAINKARQLELLITPDKPS